MILLLLKTEVGAQALIGVDFPLQHIFLKEGPAKIAGTGLIAEVGSSVEA